MRITYISNEVQINVRCSFQNYVKYELLYKFITLKIIGINKLSIGIC